jgi:hypothetical protein
VYLEFCFEAADQFMHEATIQSSVEDLLHCRDTRTYYYTDRIILYCISSLSSMSVQVNASNIQVIKIQI